MSKFRVSGNKSSILVYPTAKPELSLDLVNARSIDPAYSFTRNSAATYVGPDGYIKTAAVNQPRFDCDPISGKNLGLLIEESSTNLRTNSENLELYGSQRVTITKNGNFGSPDNLYNASLIVPSSENNTHITSLGVYSSSKTVSLFAKSENYDSIKITSGNAYWAAGVTFNLLTGSITISSSSGGNAYQSSNIIKYPNGWWRCIVSYNTELRHTIWITVGNNSVIANSSTFSGDGVSGVYVWGVQVESLSFPTSYIPTTSSAVTRQPDQLILNKTLNTQGTFFVESNPSQGVPLVTDNGTSQPASSLLIDQPLNQYTRSALYYNTNKTLIMGSDNSNPEEFNFSSPANLNFNRVLLGFDGNNYINGYFKKFSYYSSPLSEDNLRALTSNIKSIDRFTNLIASGGTITEIVENNINYRVHTFTTVGISYFNIYESTEIEYLVVAGGGSGGGPQTGGGAGGGGGGGGVLSGTFQTTPSTFSIYVGAGGVRAKQNIIGNNGQSSSISNVVEALGGGGGGRSGASGSSGGSGGGGGSPNRLGGSGTAGQGFGGGTGSPSAGGGGGGASEPGSSATPNNGGNGGDGVISTITGQSVIYGGGGGGSGLDSGGTGGTGGGGDGGVNTADPGVDGLGGGGGAMRLGGTGFGERGGSGIVIIRYKV